MVHEAPRAEAEHPLIIREAEKDGKKVSGATLAADGSVSLQFGEARTAEQANDLDKWMAKHNAN
ncbi:MAG TPA: hypothetical protein VNZ53_32245 [Steroidobacteraceae bacterium]|jgi:hypothetical protein|nr:hypothetical protein [Steroidobacteraceae bacterium]